MRRTGDVDNEPVLCSPRDQRFDCSDPRAGDVTDLDANQVFRPVLVFSQVAPLSGMDVATAYLLGVFSGADPNELDLMALVGASDCLDAVRALFHQDRAALLKVDQVLVVNVETEIPVETVWSAESPDQIARISR